MGNPWESGPGQRTPDQKNCPHCNGTGKDGKGNECKHCRGSGKAKDC